MNGKIDFLADSNTLLYILRSEPCIQAYLDKLFGISIISEIELLCYKNIQPKEEATIKSLINDCEFFGLDNAVKEETIRIRKKYGVKLPDAIIAATAIVNNLNLLTADKGFKKIAELNVILLQP